eukprot:Skav231080  [mRNA]  locus=scaffold524:406035:422683:- [translate_table: standard]
MPIPILKSLQPTTKTCHTIANLHNPFSCAVCKATTDLSLCSSCESARFCSRDCQRRFWPRHQKVCRFIASVKGGLLQQVAGKKWVSEALPEIVDVWTKSRGPPEPWELEQLVHLPHCKVCSKAPATWFCAESSQVAYCSEEIPRHTSYTKGLVLVDSSGGERKRVLELTSNDCIWRTKKNGGASWSTVDEPQLLSFPDANGDEMTAFKMQSPRKNSGNMMSVGLLMKVDGSFKDIADLHVTCKPGHHINTKIAMTSKEDINLVQGQLGPRGHTEAGENRLSLLQGMHQRMRSDSEFETSQSWTDLGGSEAAAFYLKGVDKEGLALYSICSEQEKTAATAICKQYLGEVSASDKESFQNHFESCVFDVCHGGGEDAAQLAAEIMQA